MYPRPGFVEMDEMLVWQQAQDVVKDAISGDFMFFLLCFFSKKIFLYVHCFDTISWKGVQLVMQSEGALECCSSLCLLWKVCHLNKSYVKLQVVFRSYKLQCPK